ncbi:MAG: thiamine-phosphate kinase [Deltaproteobacteria bacterium]|nr:thiamine-phosphate kinase [Deltaproteobacteria bacterium]MCL5276306.1 thiamine-phosphate kinase [Deltaproteobacteria bacterium]
MKDWEELKLIKGIRALAHRPGHGVLLGIGDDAAVIKTPAGSKLLCTVDSIVDGVHFLGELNEWESAGKRALGAAISDIAAMGGVPLYALLSLFLPARFPVRHIDMFMKGFMSRVREYGISLIGGNIAGMLGSFAADTVVIGSAYRGRFIRRSGAGEGDAICIAGITGEAMAGLDLIRLKDTRSYPVLVKRYLEPSPMLRESIRIVDSMSPTSMIDVSDGLLRDLSHILDESRKGAEISLDSVPVTAGVRHAARLLGKSPYDYVLTGGDDYVLLFTVPEKRYRSRINGTRVYRIGKIVRGRGIKLYEHGKKVSLALHDTGYVHRG